ncbi:MAG: class 3 [Lasallia pustulata]|uniref:Class 3 n=1 Tax=Lasallia pustulata TaxID=136370 RepID=A0A5M8PD48_9LECA|nr:MAG: class 3 [Lasallia pustulata]
MTEACELMPAFPIRRRRAGAAQILIIVVVLSLVLLYNLRSASGWASTTGPGEEIDASTATTVAASAVSVPSNTPLQSSPRREKELVVASLDSDDVSWLYDNIKDWTKNIYVVDNPAANLTVPVNKGRESMAYLTFIIDNYSNLPDVMVFMHSLRYQWHNDEPMYDGIPILQNLRVENIQSRGYVNLRCVWVIGCPAEMHPLSSTTKGTEVFYADAFKELFPDTPVPETVSVSCCAQFAASSWKVLERPKADYERYRDWLRNSTLPDYDSGRIMEYTWHMIFGMPAVHCPNAKECYCETFGWCNETCYVDRCEGRYTLPPYSTMPKGWPEEGWGP